MADISYISGREVAQATGPTSQVYKATHKGSDYLSYMERSFISFSFGGKNIEDFELIATNVSDRMEKSIYASFDDIVTSNAAVDGQLYWKTHFNTVELNFTLSTDALDEQTLNEFARWFAPGQTKELILSEHPNRVIQARVRTTPEYHLLAFEKVTSVMIGGQEYVTKTTCYKGEITISFISDDPFWYARSNILKLLDSEEPTAYDKWLNANGIPTYLYDDPDALKIVLEDGIPTNVMLMPDVMVGNKFVISDDNIDRSKIDNERAKVKNEDSYDTALIGPIFSSTEGMNLAANDYAYLYYAGTAPAKPILSFTLTPQFNNAGYISTPYNDIAGSTTPYNTIVLEGTNQIQNFCFTTPTVLTSYNEAIKVFKDYAGKTALEIRAGLRAKVHHYDVRAYAIAIANDSRLSNAVTEMKKFFATDSIPHAIDFVFNGETGETFGTFYHWRAATEQYETSEENVGDMVRSPYLSIRDRNFPTVNGYIVSRDYRNSSRPEDNGKPENSHRISHDVPNGLQKLLVEYKYMYL